MDKDRIAGSAKQFVGAVKQAVGKLIGNSRLDGTADNIEGKVQNAIGSLKVTTKQASKKT